MHEGLPEWFFALLRIEGECWVWTGSKGGSNEAYGVTCVFGKQQYAHRLAWFLVNGELPTGGNTYHYKTMQVCHHCDNPPCCRPSHLFKGTPSDNFRDALAKGRKKQPKSVGEKNSMSKLTVDDVKEIRVSTESNNVLAQRFSVTKECIHAVRKRRTWAHVLP